MNPTLTAPQDQNPQKHKGFVTNGTLTLFAFTTAFFPRVVAALKIPSAINFLHFVAIPFACGSTLLKARSKDPNQIATSNKILGGLYFMLTVCFASAFLNDAGVVNALLSFLLLTEPFMLVLTIASLPMSTESYTRFRTWIFRCGMVNLIFAYVQKYAFRLERFQGIEDNIKGVFIGQGAGHVIGGSVSITFGIYYLITAKSQPLWVRIVILLATLNHIIISDTKQVMLSFILGYLLLYLTNLKNPVKTLMYLIGAAIFLIIFYWAIYNIEYLGGFTVWIRPEIYGPDGEATRLKLAAFRIIPQYFHSPLNWLLGLGPGHTVGRLGGWMLDIYWNLLGPLGATKSPASGAVWQAVGESWLGDQSSMFSPLFGWAGIWGDLGFLGLAAYFYLAFLIWQYVAPGDLARYLMFTVFAFGCVFSQIEEPGYMLFVAALIGLQWHERKYRMEKS
jgi:hypothetical protein